MFLSGGSFWVSVSALLFTLFCFLTRILTRIHRNRISQTKKSNSPYAPLGESIRLVSGCSEPEDKKKEEKSDADEVQDREGDMSEEESPEFCFKFEFQTETFEKFSKSYRGAAEDVVLDSVPSSSQSKYEIMSGNDLSCFVEKPEDKSFHVRELYTDSDKDNHSFSIKEDKEKGFLPEIDITHQNSKEEEPDLEETSENSTDNVGEKGALDEPVYEEEDDVDSGDYRFLSEKDFIAFDSDIDSIASGHDFTGNFLSSMSDGFLSDGDFEEGFELDPSMDFDGEKEESIEDLIAKHEAEADDFEDEDRDIMEELRKLEESESNSPKQNGNSQKDEINGTNNEPTTTSADSKKSSSEPSSGSESEGLETLWEHQDLIEQLKMELKKVRASGLPTIMEESECPKIMEDLKPWKIEEKFQRVDRMGELHKFYKSYRERMRKFDILNYQKMYAIGFFQSKDPLQSFSTQSSSSHPAITSLLPQNIRLGKSKKHEFDPTVKFIRELHTDLEAVYVGQLCLSWEILHWQYEKALELWESDRYGIRRYNEVAGEFQQFQVLMQRFIENEPFEGPRVQNYIKKRCVLRNLLQVPVIREDKGMARRKGKGKEDDAITGDMLVEIMEASIRIFWRFVRADKDANAVFQKSRKGTQVEPLEPNDLELLSEVQTSLQKKEKKLKELLRCGNCVLRRFKKHQEENSDQVLYFFSQVDMKLVTRVLNMSKVTTDQLLWCRSKLSSINFVNRRIHVEPSFTLFPY
ncbi:hypothetical protein SLE2022_191920 [Rubroshorea leprosula]